MEKSVVTMDNVVHTIRTMDDFIDLIYEYLGYDCAKLAEQIIYSD